MRIQHNITALSAANKLKSNESTVSKNIQKLSSGYRINSAADDAAGLAVSEKMRKQINGLSQAEDNTKNGISLIQTAEGGLNETSAILQRMNTLAVEASNGTYKDNDRKNLQLEINSLNVEINRISTSTKFNEISLLDGSLGTSDIGSVISGVSLTAYAAVASQQTVAAPTALVTDNGNQTYHIAYQDASGEASTVAVTLTLNTTAKTLTDGDGHTTTTTGASGVSVAKDVGTAIAYALGQNASFSSSMTVSSDANGVLTFVAKTAGTNKEAVTSVKEGGSSLAVATSVPAKDAMSAHNFAAFTSYDGTAATAANAVFTVAGQRFAFVKTGSDASKLGNDVNVVFTAGTSPVGTGSEISDMAGLISSKTGMSATVDAGAATQIDFKLSAGASTGNALTFQVGAENVSDQRASLNIDNMNAQGLGLQNLDISTQGGAQTAIDIVNSAIAKVSTTRAQLGALQNELEHTANNLSTMNENLTSAESTIRDVDMTDEYVQYSKNQILSQAANSMLAQANAQPQNVLTLLKG